ncbi:hypothetical protein EV424DRAFT_1343217 [Suillus variegatus]|nr:hypothetical protein EV424DRAFT_1343217 [Suillus variegatus]
MILQDFGTSGALVLHGKLTESSPGLFPGYRTKHWAKLWMIEPHFGTRLAIITNWRVDEGLIWDWHSIRAHATLVMAGVLQIYMLLRIFVQEIFFHWISILSYFILL